MLPNFKDKFCTFLLNLHDWMARQWLIVSFLASTIAIWYSFILAFAGEFFKLKRQINSSSRLTLLGWILTILLVIWTFLVQASDKYYAYRKNSDDQEAINYIRERVSARIIKVCTSKYNTLIELIDLISKGMTQPKRIISNPCLQLKTLASELAECLRSLLIHGGYIINEDDIYISIIYKFHDFKSWKQTDSLYSEKGLEIDEVVNNSKTTFSATLNSKNGIIFYNSKQEAFNKGEYIPDSCDKYDSNGKLLGSILCYRIICKKNAIDYITAIISITTYDKSLVSKKAQKSVIDNVKYNIEKHILSAFEKRISIELCLLYLSELNIRKKEMKLVSKSHKKISLKEQEH